MLQMSSAADSSKCVNLHVGKGLVISSQNALIHLPMTDICIGHQMYNALTQYPNITIDPFRIDHLLRGKC